MADMTAEEIADKMYEVIVQYAGKKLLKPMDVMKMMQKAGNLEKLGKQMAAKWGEHFGPVDEKKT